MPDTLDRTVRPVNLRLDPEATQYLRALCPPGGPTLGATVSRIILEHKLRRELSEQYKTLATREEWDATGVCVD